MRSAVLAATSFSLIAPVLAANSYVPTQKESEVAGLIRQAPYVVEVVWSQEGSLWISIVPGQGDTADDWAGVAYAVCSVLQSKGLQDAFVHLWDARAMAAGSLRRLTDRVHCG